MRYSTLVLWLMYANREPRFAVMLLGLVVGAAMSASVFVVASQLPIIFDGQPAQATVVLKRQAQLPGTRFSPVTASLFAHGRRGPRYLIDYEYVDSQGVRRRGSGRTSFSIWRDAQAGDLIAIRYSRRDPRQSVLEINVWKFWPAIPLSILGPAIIVFALRTGVAGITEISRQVILVRDGIAVPGRIVDCRRELRGKRKSEVATIIQYEYAGLREAPEIQISGKLRRNWQSGEGIVILTDPYVPANHVADIFDARREDRERLFEP